MLLPWLLMVTQSMTSGDRLLARGDTNAALRVYERLTDADWRAAEAHWRAGQLYMSRHRPGAQLSPDRRKAEEHFRYATRAEPDSAKYWLALARLLRGYSEITVRAQVPGLLARAQESRASPAVTADVAYYLARLHWERYEQDAHRYLGDVPNVEVDRDAMMRSWDNVETFLTHIRPDPGDPGVSERGAAERQLRIAVAAAPTHIGANALLAILLLDQRREAEADEVTRTLVAALPHVGTALMIRGMALARLGRWREAQWAFDHGLPLLAPEERAAYDALDVLLRRADLARLGGLPADQQARIAGLYWQEMDPLFLTQVNEPRTEFFARLTYARERWSDPERGVRGEQSERGAIYVRYGPPDVWATMGTSGSSQRLAPIDDEGIGGIDPVGTLEYEHNTVLWVYRPAKLRFVFTMARGYARATFSQDFREFYDQAREWAPVRFDNVPAVASLDTIETQAVQFRGPAPDSTVVALFGLLPLDHMANAAAAVDSQPIETLALARDTLGRPTAEIRDIDFVRLSAPQHRSWRLTLPPRTYLLRLEANLSALGHGARWSAPLTVRRYDPGRLAVSDVLLARRLAPRDSALERWTDFFIEPTAGRVSIEEPVSLLWEAYNLQPGPGGIGRWHVELRVTVSAVERTHLLARVVGGVGDAIGASAQGDDRIALAWDGEGPVQPGGIHVEYVTLDFGGAPAETYEITVLMTDRLTGHRVERSARLVRSDLPTRRGSAPDRP